jgi:hypothetical protein
VTTPIKVPNSDSISGSFTAVVESVFFGARVPFAKVPPGNETWASSQASSVHFVITYCYAILFPHRHGTKIVARSLQFFDNQIHSHSRAQKQLHVGRARGWPLGILIYRLTFTGATLFTTLSDTKSNRVPRPKA